jgi:hypothetical protein
MGHPLSTATIGRTVVVGGYVLALALAGRPVWLAVLLGLTLVLVWAAPAVLAPPRRRPAVLPAALPVVEAEEAGSP